MKNIIDLLKRVKKQGKKFVVVTGGVCSSLGKGVLTSSIGVLLKNSGYKVNVMKCDPYLNVDPGTMSPLVHGEVFVTDDGAETDLDLGHYERALGIHLSKKSSISSGQIFKEILDGEREGKFLGRCIQLVPHVVDAIKGRILEFALSSDAEFILMEIGGTAGDIEGEIFLEAIRQLRLELNQKQLFHAHLSLVPLLEWANELKTKPTQHSVMMLKKAGLTPDGLFLRSDKKLTKKSLEKVSSMCGVDKSFVVQVLTYKPLYKLFSALKEQGLNRNLQEWFQIKKIKESDLSEWEDFIKKIEKKKKSIKIGLIAKYVGSSEPYISVIEAIKAAGYHSNRDVELLVIEAGKLEKKDKESLEQLKSVDGIVMPGGFDERGVEGKIAAVKWARENNIPYLGLCLGMQVLLIEAGRSLLKLKDASSTEFNKKTKNPIISLLEEQKKVVNKGGSMRLGAYPCSIEKKTLAHKAYGESKVMERHRHRYEFNNEYKKEFEKAGIVFSGLYKKENLVEIAELKDHPFMVGCQFHPEFLSNPLKPHPLFKLFVETILNLQD
jgi:CTP synthase